MKPADLQIDMFKHHIKCPGSVCYATEGEYIYFSIDGISAFALPANEVCIDLKKLREIESLKKHFMLTKKDREVQPTGIYVQCADCLNRKLKCDTFSVYVKKTLFDRYTYQKLYCESPVSPVKLVPKDNRVTAVVLPVRVMGDETC
ncbi:hypothetical protein CE91St44_16020 [Oscillospiraceae bacterium]|nr:hypothetical protein CE91St44_16020 [Oscillospiraceae bacterium]DAI92778.1 MAG TPA: hypothetical protein [Caudoviricetes sp.]